jgi:hypothetical protein
MFLIVVYLKVAMNDISNSISDYYNFDLSSGEFVPGECFVGKTIGDLVEAKVGLSDADVEIRLSVIGPNSIPMKPPNYVKSFIKEFSGIFYLYQNYLTCCLLPLLKRSQALSFDS